MTTDSQQAEREAAWLRHTIYMAGRSADKLSFYAGWDARAAGRAEVEEARREIAYIIEHVDQRCAAVDGPVTPTLKEMTQQEISRIYQLASEGSER